jgi:hypothetical protein
MDGTASPASAGKTWPDVADTALHYVAGGLIVAAVGFFAYQGKIGTDFFVALITAAAGAVGFKGITK